MAQCGRHQVCCRTNSAMLSPGMALQYAGHPDPSTLPLLSNINVKWPMGAAVYRLIKSWVSSSWLSGRRCFRSGRVSHSRLLVWVEDPHFRPAKGLHIPTTSTLVHPLPPLFVFQNDERASSTTSTPTFRLKHCNSPVWTPFFASRSPCVRS